MKRGISRFSMGWPCTANSPPLWRNVVRARMPSSKYSLLTSASELSYKKLVILRSDKPDPLFGCLSCLQQNSRRVPQRKKCYNSLKCHQSDIILASMEQFLEFLLDLDVANPSGTIWIIHKLKAIQDLEKTFLRCFDKLCEVYPGTPEVLVRRQHIPHDLACKCMKIFKFHKLAKYHLREGGVKSHLRRTCEELFCEKNNGRNLCIGPTSLH
jgi:hypothetical protein